jgi:hypothetical protein
MGVWDDIWDGIEAVERWTTIFPSPKPVSLSREGFGTTGPFGKNVVDPATREATTYENAALSSSERFFQGWKYVRDNVISQPVSTLVLQGKRAGEDPGVYFSASEWSRAWRAANYISPGQAAFGTTALTADAREMAQTAEGMIDSPLLHYKPPDSYLPAGFNDLPEDEQQRILKEIGMPIDPSRPNKYIEDMRERSDVFKYGSGVGDFGMAWFADPLIIGGKAAGMLRRAAVVKTRPAAGWSPEQIDKIVNSSKMSRLIDFMEKNADNPMLVNNTDAAMKSAFGPRFGAINAVLKSPEERMLFIRTGMGDVSAMERLERSNALARARIRTDGARLAAMDLSYARYAGSWDPRLAALAEGEMGRLNAAIEADTAMVGRYEQILAHADMLDEINLSRWSFTRAEERTAAQLGYLARPARGGSLALRRGGKGMAARQFTATTTPPIAFGGMAPRSVESGFVATRLWGVGDFFTTPVTLVRMMKNVHPNGYMHLDQGAAFEASNIAELRAQLARIPGVRADTRQSIINQWLKSASEGERVQLLEDLHRLAVSKIAAKHGLSPKAGTEIFEAQREKLMGQLDKMRQYTASAMPREGELPLRVDAFETEGGIKIAPHTVSRIINSHVLPDLTEFNKVLARHSSALRALRESHAGNPDWILAGGDMLNSLWKFGVLFRLGYIPRVAGDDLASQMARLGAAQMMLRTGYGVKNGLTNLAHRSMRGFNVIEEKTRVQGMEYARGELALLQPEMRKLGGRMAAERAARERDVLVAENRLGKAEVRLNNLPATVTPTQRRAVERFVEARQNELARARTRAQGTVWPGKSMRLRDLELRAGMLEQYYNLSAKAANDAWRRQQKVWQGSQTVKIGDLVFPAAFGGERGSYQLQRISPDQAYDQLFKTNKQLVHGNLVRSFDHGARPISAIDDEAKHAEAWAHAINAQITGDTMQRMLVSGRPEAEVVNWLKSDPAGRAYWRRLNLEMTTPEDVVARARHEVDDYLPLPEIRAQALTEEGVTPQFLKQAMPRPDHRPTVHIANTGPSPFYRGDNEFWQAADRIMKGFYSFAVTLPAKRLSRHPLYNQLYEGHLRTLVSQRARHAADVETVADVEHVTEVARRLAEKDMKRLVFDIAHRSDASAALRFISPFFSATAESFQRWGRVIADRPEVLGYAANFYNAPAYLGHMQDQDGNRIFPDGTAMLPNPETGKLERRLVPKGDRWIVARMPEWFVNSPLGVAFGVERSSGNMRLSQNSMNVVTQGDPWFSPGVGPVVQIPVAEYVKDKPAEAELARHLGVLPFGPPTGGTVASRAARQALPATVRTFLTAFDTSDYRYQQVKLQIMQRAIYEHEELGKPMLSAQEIADQTRNYWLFSAASAFLQPMATQRKDAYQYYRDQYNNLRRQDPETADQEFLSRFGESYFIFAQAMSKNLAGVPATKRAVELSKEYADVLSEFPEFGALIIGPEGNGPFSPEAYSYQLNTPLVPGDTESQRRRMTAEEAVKENERRKGWAYFTAVMNWLNAQAVQRGLHSIDAKGAESLANTKKAFVMLLSSPTIGGKENKHYNAAWAEDYDTFQPHKYDRMAPALESVAKSVLAKDPDRGDMRTLLMYLEGRKVMIKTLKGSAFSTLGAKANAGLRGAWTSFVGQLTESNTDFGDLHSRYLSRDLGVDIEDDLQALEAAKGVAG